MFITLAVVFGLVSMLSYGLANAFSRALSQELGPPQMLFLRSWTMISILLVASLPSLVIPHDWRVVAATIALGMFGYLPVLAFTHGIKSSRIGIVAPIAGTSPLITVLLAFAFLGTAIHAGQWVAITMVALANIIVSVDIRNWRQSNALQLSSGIPYAVFAAIGWGIFFFLLVPAATSLGPWLATLCVELGVAIASGVHIWATRQPVAMRDALKPDVIMNGILICIGTLAFTVGVRYFNVGIVAALSNSTALVAAVLATYMFHERLNRTEKIAGAVMVLGVVIIVLA